MLIVLIVLRMQPQKRLFHAAIETTIFRVGMQSVNPSIKPFCSLLRETTQRDAAIALLAKLDRNRRDRWSEAVRSIDFSHSSRKAWSILNNLAGRSRHSPRLLADSIASQLVRNGKYESVDRKSSRLVSQEVSDLWRATTSDTVNISDNFHRENLLLPSNI